MPKHKKNKTTLKGLKEDINRISVADFEIESNKASLTELEECMNRLIKRNKRFAEFRRRKVIGEHIGMIG